MKKSAVSAIARLSWRLRGGDCIFPQCLQALLETFFRRQFFQVELPFAPADKTFYIAPVEDRLVCTPGFCFYFFV
ncbi:MAG TPA: hypothetical protein VIK35_03445 [Verrucomicrobiae bacterium]